MYNISTVFLLSSFLNHLYEGRYLDRAGLGNDMSFSIASLCLAFLERNS